MAKHYHRLKRLADKHATKLRKKGLEVQVHAHTAPGPYKWCVYSYKR
jgi:hypothetical protein